jgi:hypothetical protein
LGVTVTWNPTNAVAAELWTPSLTEKVKDAL